MPKLARPARVRTRKRSDFRHALLCCRLDSGGSDTCQSKYVQDVLSCNKQDVPSDCVSLEASDQSIDGSSSVDTGVVISIHDAVIREQQLSNIVVADTSAGANIDRFSNSNSQIIIFFLR